MSVDAPPPQTLTQSPLLPKQAGRLLCPTSWSISLGSLPTDYMRTLIVDKHFTTHRVQGPPKHLSGYRPGRPSRERLPE